MATTKKKIIDFLLFFYKFLEFLNLVPFSPINLNLYLSHRYITKYAYGVYMLLTIGGRNNYRINGSLYYKYSAVLILIIGFVML